MKKTLIVDDDPLILFGLSKALHDICDEVHEVATGENAISSIKCGFYNLCFLDIHLPDANGLDLMDMIEEISPETKVVIMTAERVDHEMRKKILEKAYRFVAKPFDLVQVRTIANQALEGGENGNTSDPDIFI